MGGIPGTDWLIKETSTREHASHALNALGVPLGDGPVGVGVSGDLPKQVISTVTLEGKGHILDVGRADVRQTRPVSTKGAAFHRCLISNGGAPNEVLKGVDTIGINSIIGVAIS